MFCLFFCKDLMLKVLELFEICVWKFLVQVIVVEIGLLVSIVLYYLWCLEDYFGVVLFDYFCWLMMLMLKGQVFLKDIEGVLLFICKVIVEVSIGNVMEMSYFRFGSIVDLDSDIMLDFVVYFF